MGAIRSTIRLFCSKACRIAYMKIDEGWRGKMKSNDRVESRCVGLSLRRYRISSLSLPKHPKYYGTQQHSRLTPDRSIYGKNVTRLSLVDYKLRTICLLDCVTQSGWSKCDDVSKKRQHATQRLKSDRIVLHDKVLNICFAAKMPSHRIDNVAKVDWQRQWAY